MSRSRNVQSERAPKAIQAPTPLSRKLVRYLVGFGVGVGVGLAPYLGLINVPPFKSLLSLIPGSVQDAAIPLSAALMGAVAVAVQWYGEERVSRAWLRRMFARTLVVAALSFILLTVVYNLVVVNIPMGDGAASFVVGFVRPEKPACPAEVSDAMCIKLLTLDPAEVTAFWGDGQVRLAKLALTFSYLLFTGSFGMLVGFVVLREAHK